MENLLEILATLFIAIVTTIIGYHIGLWKFFQEKRLSFYEQALPVFLEMAYGSNPSEREVNKAQARMWIFASKRVALEVDNAISAYYKAKKDSQQGEKYVKAMQRAIVYMRKDIQPWWRAVFTPLQPKDVLHLYSHIMPSDHSQQSDADSSGRSPNPQQ